MSLSVRAVLGLSVAVSLSACTFGNYRVVRKVSNGGEVALEGVQDEARQKADAYMKGQCPTGYDVVEEGEAVVGQTASSESQPTRTLFGQRAVATQTSTTDKREWRIKYQCKGAVTEQTTSPTQPASSSPQGKIHELIIRF